MKRIFAVASFIFFSAGIFAADIDTQANTSGAYSTDTAAFGVIISPKQEKNSAESLPGRAILISSAGYFNYAYIADNRLGYGLLFDSILIAGSLSQYFSYDASENRQNIVYEISGIVSSLGMTGLTYYPLYELYESYTYKNCKHTARGWIGCGVLVIDMIVLSADKYEAVPVGFMYDGINTEMFLSVKF